MIILHYFLQKEARGEKERATKDEWMREGRRTERNKRKGKKEKYSLLSKLIPFVWTNNYIEVQNIFICIYGCYVVLHFKTLNIFFLKFCVQGRVFKSSLDIWTYFLDLWSTNLLMIDFDQKDRQNNL